jgi:hemerythrin-like metal-binding protein
MDDLESSEDLLVGVREVDEQHLRILICLEGLNSKIKKRSAPETNLYELRKLNVVIDEHFYTEEHLLKEYNYPYIEDHLKEHNEMSEKFRKLYNTVHSGLPTNATEHLLNDLINHVKKHVMETDIKSFKIKASKCI